jgi:hypothetical protein
MEKIQQGFVDGSKVDISTATRGLSRVKKALK